MPPKGTRGRKGKSKAAPPPEPDIEQVQPQPTPEDAEEVFPNEKVKKKKTVTAFSEQEKEEIIEFLMRNEVLYSKRLAGFKDVTQKEDLWAAQAAKMNTTVEQLKTWYSSIRTMMGRLKKRAKKSGSGGDAITGMNSTEHWVWDKFSFLIPHIETVEDRNVASFVAAAASVNGTELTTSTDQTSEVASTSSSVPTPPFQGASLPPASQTASQPGSVGLRRGSEERLTSGELKELLVEFMSRSTRGSGSSFFGKYVEETLSKLPGAIRRDAEANIMQELHRAQKAAEHSETQPPPSQQQQVSFEQQSQQFQQQFRQTMWQPHPSQWPPRPVGPQPSIWGSQDRSYVQLQFPTQSMNSPLPPITNPKPGTSGAKYTTMPTTTTAMSTTIHDSFVSLLGPNFNSPQLSTSDRTAEEDDPRDDQ